jgi:hypothetical protein
MFGGKQRWGTGCFYLLQAVLVQNEMAQKKTILEIELKLEKILDF